MMQKKVRARRRWLSIAAISALVVSGMVALAAPASAALPVGTLVTPVTNQNLANGTSIPLKTSATDTGTPKAGFTPGITAVEWWLYADTNSPTQFTTQFPDNAENKIELGASFTPATGTTTNGTWTSAWTVQSPYVAPRDGAQVANRTYNIPPGEYLIQSHVQNAEWASGQDGAAPGMTAQVVVNITGTTTVVTPPSGCAATSYSAQLFNNMTLTGTPTVTRCDTAVNFTWPDGTVKGTNSPAATINTDGFSARWTTTPTLAAGNYKFDVSGDDGVRVLVDGVKIIDGWKDQHDVAYTLTKALTAGAHTIVVEYYENAYDADVHFTYASTTVSPPPPPPTTCAATSYSAQFYNNLTLVGTPIATRCDTAVDFTWGAAAPMAGVNADGFSAQWTSTQTFAAGNYKFNASGDDGVRVLVDGTKILDGWKDQHDVAYTATVALTAGSHVIVYQYYENAYDADAHFSFAAAGGVVTPPPTGCLATQYAAQFYNNMTLTGTPVLSRCDAGINYTWPDGTVKGTNSPDPLVNTDAFSARWTQSPTFTAGNYLFTLTGDDGIRLLVDGVDVLDGWKDQGATTYTLVKTLTAGTHTLVVEYYEDGYDATAQFSYAASVTTPPPPAGGTNLYSNPNLSAGTTIPDCFIDGSWGTNTVVNSFSTSVPTGATGRSYQQVISKYTSGDVKIMPSDANGCIANMAAGTTYTASVAYKATTTSNNLVTFTYTPAAGWVFWNVEKVLGASAAWTTVSVDLGTPPAGTTKISFGLAAASNGTINTTAYSLVQTSNVVAPPTGTPATIGSWSYNPTNSPLRAVHSSLLPDGRILMMAGDGNDAGNFAAGTFSTSIWDPIANTFTTIPTPYDMFCAGHVNLPDGRVLIAGGTLAFPGVNGAPEFEGSSFSYIFDPKTNAFTKTNNTMQGHWYPTLTKLATGDVWMAGGLGADGNGATGTEMFKTSTGAWQPLSATTQTGTYWGGYPTMFLLANGNLFYTGSHVFGGQRPGTGSSVYNITAGTIGDINTSAEGSDAALRDQGPSVLLYPAQAQKFLIMGGGDIDGGLAPTNSAATIDMNATNPAWTKIASFPGPGKQYVNALNLFDGTVLEADGASGTRTNNVMTAALFNPVTNTWTAIDPDPEGRGYHGAAILIPDGRVIFMGGNPIDNSWDYKITIYSPPYLFKGTRPTITTAPTTMTYGGSYTIGVTGAPVSASLYSLASPTHQTDTNERMVALTVTGTGATRSVTVPTNKNLTPPGEYMLTTLDANGVPSVAKIVSVG